jgi:hypothetical protein
LGLCLRLLCLLLKRKQALAQGRHCRCSLLLANQPLLLLLQEVLLLLLLIQPLLLLLL